MQTKQPKTLANKQSNQPAKQIRSLASILVVGVVSLFGRLKDVLIKKYKEAESNLKKLEHLGASLLHGLDATKMKLHTDLRMRRMHRNLVHGFFRNASGMLRADGEIHVNHKTSAPFNHWNLEELAAQNSLALIGCVDFKIADYPGYNNKRGASLRCDEPFPLGECSTFKFIFSPTTKKMPKAWTNMGRFQHLHETPIQPLQKPIYYEPIQPQTNLTASMNHQLPYVWSPQTVNIRNDCCRIFHGYHNHIMQTFGRTDCDLYYSVHDALKSGFDRYMTEVPGRDLNGYIQLLEELRRLSIMRLARLQMMLGPDHRL
ncbi:25S rRNA (uracil2634-N3)-methyltransferase [Sarracenia purpurea var. burkii]